MTQAPPPPPPPQHPSPGEILERASELLQEANLTLDELNAERDRVVAETVVTRQALCDLRAEHAALLREMKASKKLFHARTRALSKMREQIREHDEALQDESRRPRFPTSPVGGCFGMMVMVPCCIGV